MSASPATGLGPTQAGERVVCGHAARCAGCPLIALPYADQLAAKRALVTGALAHYPALEGVETEPVAPAQPVVGYRTRAKLMVGPGGALGLYARGGGHQVVDIPDCRVLTPALAQVASELRGRIAAAQQVGGPLAPCDPAGHGSLRAVDLREVRDGDGPPSVLLTLVLERANSPSLRALAAAAADLIRSVPTIIGVAANFHEAGSPQVLGGETTVLAGVHAAQDRVGASRQLATYGSFVQAHRGQAARIHAVVAEAVGCGGGATGLGPTVLDLYAGSGAVGLGLAAAGARVHMVESFAPAVAQTQTAARQQGLEVQADCGDAAQRVSELAEQHRRFDAVVLNPPRRGASPEVREGLARLAPDRIVYISCDPQTLARDLDHFARCGYRAPRVRSFDMIPLSNEVEAVAVLERGDPPAPPVIYEDTELLVVGKGPHEPTTGHRGHRACLTERVRALQGAERAVPILPLESDTGGLALFAKSADHVTAWSTALSAPTARAVYLVGVRGVLRAKGSIARPGRDRGREHDARTRYRRVAIFGGHTLLRATPDSGRDSQVRLHMAAIGHPVLGDARHGDRATNRHFAEKYGLDRSFLQCARIELDHPRTGERLVLQARLAGDLCAVLERHGQSLTPVLNPVA